MLNALRGNIKIWNVSVFQEGNSQSTQHMRVEWAASLTALRDVHQMRWRNHFDLRLWANKAGRSEGEDVQANGDVP